jgi:hypothetical protein
VTRILWNVLIGVDQTANAVIGGNPDETISSRVGKAARTGGWRATIAEAVIDLIFAILAGQRRHCENSIEWDEK